MNKTVILKKREEMEAALLAVDGDPLFQEKFYPLLLKRAGTAMYQEGISMIFSLAIHDFIKQAPDELGLLLDMRREVFIDAMIVED